MNKNFFLRFYNFYFFASCTFTFFYLAANLFSSYWDGLFIYLLSLKPSIGQEIYKDYSFQHAPYLNFFFQLLNYFFQDSYNLLLVLGIIQSLFAGYLSYLFCSKIIKSSFIKKVCFVITIFSFSIEYNFFYHDAYVFLIGIYSLYLIFIKKNIFIGNLFLALVFFLKQTFGFTFVFIYFFIIIYESFYKKKFIFLKSIIYFFVFIIIYLLLIFIFSDIKKFYYENVLFTFFYAEHSAKNSLLNYIFGIFFLLPNISSVDELKIIFSRVNFSYSQVIFYIIFRLPTFLINFYLLYKIRDFGKDYYKVFLIIILSTILPQPLLGRLYWGTIYFFPIVPIIFIVYISEKKNYSITNSEKILKKIIYIYSFIVFLYLALCMLQRVNYIEFSEKFIIKSKKHFFLNIHKKQIDNNDFDYVRDMYEFMRNLEIKKGVYLLDTSSMSILFLLNQPILNRDFTTELSESSYHWKERKLKYPGDNKNFSERFIIDIKEKKPEFVLYKIDEFYFIKKILPYNIFKDYNVKYANSKFALLEKVNN
jgi:hypothetical protein